MRKSFAAGPPTVPMMFLEIAGELRILDQQVGAGDLLLGALHLLPQALLVAFGRLEAGTDQRDHVLRPDPRLGDAGVQRSRGGRPADEQRAAASSRGSARTSARLLSLRRIARTASPGFIRPEQPLDHLRRALRRAQVAELDPRAPGCRRGRR